MLSESISFQIKFTEDSVHLMKVIRKIFKNIRNKHILDYTIKVSY